MGDHKRSGKRAVNRHKTQSKASAGSQERAIERVTRQASAKLERVPKSAKCEAEGPICSGEMVRTYSVNGSAEEGQTFKICAPCKVYLGRTSRLTEVEESGGSYEDRVHR